MSIASRVSRALLYGPDTKYGHPTAGTEASIQSMSIDSLKNHYSTNYGPDKTTLIVVGDVTETEIIDKANSYFGSWFVDDVQINSQDNTVEDQTNKTTIFLADKPGAAQSVISVGHLTVGRSHSDYFALTLMNYVFGGQFAGRLNMNLRQDKGYSYGYMSGINWSRYASPFLAGGSVQTDVTKEAVEETIREFQDIKGRRQITEDEFQTARDGILRALPAQFETHEQIMAQLENLAVFDLPLDYFSHLEEKIKAVELSDVHRVAKENINDSGLNILVVGDRSSIELGMKELNLPIIHIDYDGRPLQ
jgi:zinc protease